MDGRGLEKGKSKAKSKPAGNKRPAAVHRSSHVEASAQRQRLACRLGTSIGTARVGRLPYLGSGGI